MPEKLARIDVRDHLGTPVVAVAGDVDLSNAHELRVSLESLGTPGIVAIDMTDLVFIDSTGVNAIAVYGRGMLEDGNALYLIVNRPSLRRIFEITNLDQHFTVLKSLDDLP